MRALKNPVGVASRQNDNIGGEAFHLQVLSDTEVSACGGESILGQDPIDSYAPNLDGVYDPALGDPWPWPASISANGRDNPEESPDNVDDVQGRIHTRSGKVTERRTERRTRGPGVPSEQSNPQRVRNGEGSMSHRPTKRPRAIAPYGMNHTGNATDGASDMDKRQRFRLLIANDQAWHHPGILAMRRALGAVMNDTGISQWEVEAILHTLGVGRREEEGFWRSTSAPRRVWHAEESTCWYEPWWTRPGDVQHNY